VQLHFMEKGKVVSYFSFFFSTVRISALSENHV